MRTCYGCNGARAPRPGQGTCGPCHAAYARAHRRRHSELTPEQRKRANCRSYTNMLVRRGIIQRQPCESCGSPKAQAHHPDYDNPRLVHWLCRACHLAHHAACSTGNVTDA